MGRHGRHQISRRRDFFVQSALLLLLAAKVFSTTDSCRKHKLQRKFLGKMVKNAHARGHGRQFGQKQSHFNGEHMTMMLMFNRSLKHVRTQIGCQPVFLHRQIDSRHASPQLRACHKVGSRRTKTSRVKCTLITFELVNFDNVALQWQQLVGWSGTTTSPVTSWLVASSHQSPSFPWFSCRSFLIQLWQTTLCTCPPISAPSWACCLQ
jgi:hypothetical protein